MVWLKVQKTEYLENRTFLGVIEMSMSTVSFLGQLRLWNSLPPEYFPLTYDLNVTLCKKCPNTELFLVRIFLYSD